VREARVVVVGAGPTGSACALTLARLAPEVAAETVVLEKARHPREKYCGGAISCWGVGALDRLGVGVQVPNVPIRGIAVRYGDEVATARGELGVVVRRQELDASIAEAARRVVGELREDARVVAIDRDGDRFVVRTATGDVRTEVVVGADGAGSAVRKLLGFPEPRRKAHLYVLETPATAGDGEDGVITFDLTCLAAGVEGYAWDFPTVIDGAPAVSRGIYHLNSRRPGPGEQDVPVKEALRAFLAHRGCDLDRVHLKAFAERGYVPAAEIARPGVLLAGEAAGVDPVTGEGIAQALLYGELAARAIADGARRGDLGFRGYAASVRRSFVGRHLAQAAWLAPHVYGARARKWASFLVREPLAMQAGLAWYRGEPLGLGTKARLAARLVRSFALGIEVPAT
jgi:flavin-dependent dehydrogenase